MNTFTVYCDIGKVVVSALNTNKCVLPKPRYVPFHAYPITDTYTLHNGIVTWHFSICLSLISIGLLALGLLLSAQLCCARPWSFERKFLIMFHSFLMVDYIAVIVFLVTRVQPLHHTYKRVPDF